jgi:hypothetical protein
MALVPYGTELRTDAPPDYLMNGSNGSTDAAKMLMQDLLAKIKVMRELDFTAMELEEKAKKARQAFDEYKAKTVVTAMQATGFTTLKDDNGLTISLENKYYLNPNKNDADRKIINDWLKKYGGDHLLKHQGIVPEAELDKLKENNIPFDDKIDVNTNSLKSFVLDLLGYKKGGAAKIELKDIPDCMHFVVANDIIVES